MITNEVATTRRGERSRLTLGRERLIGVAAVVAAAAALLLAAQIHRWIAPHDSDGAAGELVPVAISGLLGWAAVFGAALIGPHRAAEPAKTSRRYALAFGVLAVPMVVLAYWTPIPWCLGVGGLLLIRRAHTYADRSRVDRVATGLALLAIVAPVAIFVGVIVAALS